MNRSLFMFALFLFVWPTVTVLSLALAPLDLPTAAHTFATSAMLVPTMVYAIVPALTKVLTKQVPTQRKTISQS